MEGQRGQATVEWIALVLLVAGTLGVGLALAPHADGRSFGGLILHRLVCGARGGCDDGDAELEAAYGNRDASLVRRYAPSIAYEPGTLSLPVDFRACRDHECADAPDDPELDVHRALRGGTRATAFTHVVRAGGETFLQYWLYYPDSTTGGPAKVAWDAYDPAGRQGADSTYPGFHRDDWESLQIRIGADGRASSRASSHHGYQWCKASECAGAWGRDTGWTRVSRGSHAGHVPLRPTAGGQGYEPTYPGADVRERSSTAAALRLVPLERLDQDAYRPLDPEITPPWRKRVYIDPRSDSTG